MAKKEEVEVLKKIKEKITGSGEKEEKIEKLKERYGVMRTIPEQKVEEVVEIGEKPKKKEEEALPDLLLRMERLSGRIDTLDDFRKAIDERVTRIAEEMGELRSSLIERDRRISEVEKNAEKAFEAVSELLPEKIKKRFENTEKEILEIRAELEKLSTLTEMLRDQNKELADALEKIKDVENLVEISRGIDEKLSKIEETRLFADRTAAKVEVMFSELSEKLRDLESQKEKVKRLDELSVDLVKMLDEMSVKLGKYVEKEDFEKLRKELSKSVEESIKERLKGLDISEIKKLGDRIKGIEESLSKVSSKIEELKKVEVKPPSEELEKLKKIMSELTNTLATSVSSIEKTWKELSVKLDLEFSLIQLINILQYASNPNRIKFYLGKIRGVVARMKEVGIWDKGKETLLIEQLRGIAEMWHSYGYPSISRIYMSEIEAYK